jgi:hypothetical protein
MKTRKTKRLSMRVTPLVHERLHEMAEELGTPLPDLLTVGAMAFYARAATPAEYLRAKSEFLVSEIQKQTEGPA